MMHRSGMPSGVCQMMVQGLPRSLHQTRLGTLSRNASSQDSSHEIGIESSHPSHCLTDIPRSCRPLRTTAAIRSSAVGFSLSNWA